MSHGPNPDVMIQLMQDSDWPEVQRIYSKGIATWEATFEAGVPDWCGLHVSKLAAHRRDSRLDCRVRRFLPSGVLRRYDAPVDRVAPRI